MRAFRLLPFFLFLAMVVACGGAGNAPPVNKADDSEPWTENHIPAWVGSPPPGSLDARALAAFEAVEKNIKRGFLDESWSAVSVNPNTVRMRGDPWRKNTAEFQKNVADVFSLYFKVKGFGPEVEFIDNETGDVLATVGEDGFHTEKAAPTRKKKAKR